MKASKVLLCSKNPVSGVSGEQENRLDVANFHAERFFLNLKNRSVGGFFYMLIFDLPLSSNFTFAHPVPPIDADSKVNTSKQANKIPTFFLSILAAIFGVLFVVIFYLKRC